MEAVKSIAIIGVLGLILWWLFFRKKAGAAAADTSSGGGGDVITPPAAPPDRPVPTWQGPLPNGRRGGDDPAVPPPMKTIGNGPVLSIFKGGGSILPRGVPPSFTAPPTVFKAPDNYFEKALHPPAAPVIPPTFAPRPTFGRLT